MVLNLKGVKKSQVWDGKMKIFSMNYFRKKENEKSKAKKIKILVRDDALRVVLAWLANELLGCWKWVQTWVPRGVIRTTP